MSEHIPTANEVRARIEKIPGKPYQTCAKFTYLTASRINEAVGYNCPKDKSKAVGPSGTDIKKETYEHNGEVVDLVVFTIQTEKREGVIRKIALPLDPEYEPWTKEIMEYFKKRESRKVFPFHRQQAWRKTKQHFRGLIYPIESYKIFKKIVKRHHRTFTLHALRHIRSTELIETYGFDGFELCQYCGWTLSQLGLSPSVGRYVQLQWRKYFPKLLKKRRDI